VTIAKITVPEAHRKMTALRSALLYEEPFWGALALKLRLVEDTTCPTAWTDGRSLGYNPEFVLRQTHSQLLALLAHEISHCAQGHPWRRGHRDNSQWNEACDRVINPTLRDAGYELPEGALFELDAEHLGKSAEYVYDRLPRPSQQEESDEGEEQEGESGDDDQESTGGSGGGESEDESEESEDKDEQSSGGSEEKSDDETDESEDESGEGAGQSDESEEDDEQQDGGAGQGEDGEGESEQQADSKEPDELGELRDAPDEEDEDGNPPPTESEWKQAVLEAAALAQGRGGLPDNAKRLVEDAKKSREDWRTLLWKFATEVARTDYSWTRPNHRHIGRGMYLPSLRNEQVGEIILAIDTSGSIDNVLYAQFSAEARAIVEQLRPMRVRVIYCDDRVQREDVFESGEPVEFRPVQGGGTDFRPVFDLVAALDAPPACVVYLTDLAGSFPSEDPGLPVLWVCGRPWGTAPFGEVVLTC